MAIDNLSLVALSPADMPGQQAQLVEWCTRKAHAHAIERSDFLDNERIALEHGWGNTASLHAAARRAELRQQYYEKIGAAAAEGYLIVPNFDVEVMAVRVNRKSTGVKSRSTESDYNENPDAPGLAEVRPDLLPVGVGRYVDDQATTTERRWQSKHPTATDPHKTTYHVLAKAEDFDAVDFQSPAESRIE